MCTIMLTITIHDSLNVYHVYDIIRPSLVNMMLLAVYFLGSMSPQVIGIYDHVSIFAF